MKAFTVIVKVLAALAAVAGVVYLAATYGDKVVAWAKKLLGNCSCCKCTCEDECCCEEEVPTDEAPVEEAVEEVAAPEDEPVAEETDFEA